MKELFHNCLFQDFKIPSDDDIATILKNGNKGISNKSVSSKEERLGCYSLL